MLNKNDNHIGIETIRWELNAASVENAILWQEKAGVFTRDKMGVILEEAFKPYASDDYLIEIDGFEICIDTPVVESNLEVVIREALAKKMKEIGSSITIEKHPVLNNTNLITNQPLFYQLGQYFKTGYAAFTGNSYSLNNPIPFLDALKRMPQHVLRSWIADMMESAGSGIRMVEFFSNAQLDDLLLLAFPAEEAIQKTTDLINRLLDASGVSIPRAIDKFHQVRAFYIKRQRDEAGYLKEWWESLEIFGLVSKEQRMLLRAYMKGMGSIGKQSSGDRFTSGETNWLLGLSSVDYKGAEKLKEEGIRFHTSQPKQGAERPDNIGFIQNAGAVLLYPFLKGIFTDRKWLNTRNEFIDTSLQLEAGYLLQFIITGNPDVKEYELMLPKLLCGYPSEAAISRNWNPELASREAADTVLKELIVAWPKLGNTSPEGLRNSFLIRPGKLKEEEHNWILWVERRGWDILMESLPYPISIIKLPWMDKPLFVQW